MSKFFNKSMADLHAMTVQDRKQALLEWAFEQQFQALPLQGKPYPFLCDQTKKQQKEAVDYWWEKLSPYVGPISQDSQLKQYEPSIWEWIERKTEAFNRKNNFDSPYFLIEFLGQPEPVKGLSQTMRANLEPALRSISRLRMAKVLLDNPPAFFNATASLHKLSMGELWSMPTISRRQALFEWMIEPIAQMEIEKGRAYPFMVDSSEYWCRIKIKELTVHLCKVARDQPLTWPSVGEIKARIELTQHANTKAYWERQLDATIMNLEKIKRRLRRAKLEDSLAETLGSFGAEPLQEFSQRQEAVYYMLCDPQQQRPDFFVRRKVKKYGS
jgi:hypothetical protein